MEQTNPSSKRVGIVGLGLIGGSLGLDLQRLGWKVHGLTKRSKTAHRAKERGLAQEISTNPNILAQCELVILALPLAQLLVPPTELIDALPKAAVITDVGSVKAPVMSVWNSLHPKFVPSHPMAGTTAAGVDAGQENLFTGQTWVATPDLQTDPLALQKVADLATSLGSKWITTKAELHDEAVALISHLPVLIGAALLKTLEKEDNPSLQALAKAVASSGFADTTRVGGGNPALGTAMMANNTSAILRALNAYQCNLDIFRKIIINENWQGLLEEFTKSQAHRPEFLKEPNDFTN